MRQYIAENSPDANGVLVVQGAGYRHLRTVLRVRPGDMIYVRTPDGAVLAMTCAAVDTARHVITLQLAGVADARQDAVNTPERTPPADAAGAGCEFFLFQFIARPRKMDTIIRQATECGVSKIISIEGAYCEKGNIESARSRLGAGTARWRAVIKEAREQSGSATETEALPPMTLREACDLWRAVSEPKCAVALWERADESTRTLAEAVRTKLRRDAGDAERPLAEALAGQCDKTSASDALRGTGQPFTVALAVGAEGGIALEEVRELRDAGFETVHLDTNILRCETAALYGIAAMQTILQGLRDAEGADA